MVFIILFFLFGINVSFVCVHKILYLVSHWKAHTTMYKTTEKANLFADVLRISINSFSINGFQIKSMWNCSIDLFNQKKTENRKTWIKHNNQVVFGVKREQNAV